jgi:hypothetical protein
MDDRTRLAPSQHAMDNLDPRKSFQGLILALQR